MSILKTITAAAALLLGAAAASAAPIVLDFNAAPAAYGFGSLAEDGHQVAGSGAYFLSLGGARYCSPACPDNGSNNLLSLGGSFTVTAVGGGAFKLFNFSGGEAHMDRQDLWATQIRVTGTLAGGGTVVSDFTLDWVNDGAGARPDFQNFALGSAFSNLSAVQFTGIGGNHNWFTLDDIGLGQAVQEPQQLAASASAATAAATAAAVPEPGSLLLAGLALAGLAAARRRPAAR